MGESRPGKQPGSQTEAGCRDAHTPFGDPLAHVSPLFLALCPEPKLPWAAHTTPAPGQTDGKFSWQSKLSSRVPKVN